MDFVKHVVMPIRQVAQRTSLRGFIEDYHHVDADVVLLAGETHLNRKPVGILTSPVLRVGLSFSTHPGSNAFYHSFNAGAVPELGHTPCCSPRQGVRAREEIGLSYCCN